MGLFHHSILNSSFHENPIIPAGSRI